MRFNFFSVKMDFSIEQSIASEIGQADVQTFKNQIDLIPKIVIDHFGLSVFPALVCAWYVARCESTQESETWLRSLGLVSVSDNLKAAFGQEIKQLERLSSS